MNSRETALRRGQRVAFLLKLRAGMGEAYDKSHEAVWPEMLELLKRSGVAEYSIFRRDEMLVLVMTVEDFDAVWERIYLRQRHFLGDQICKHPNAVAVASGQGVVPRQGRDEREDRDRRLARLAVRYSGREQLQMLY